MRLYTIKNSDKKVQIGKILCLVRSYRAHASEMNAPVTDKPLFFLKPSTSVIFDGQSIIVPKQTRLLQHEVELGVVIEKTCRNTPSSHALDHVLGYLVALDITARDIQSQAKQHGWPWAIAKGFDTFCPISTLILKKYVSNPGNLDISLRVNNVLRQSGNTSQLMYPIKDIISYLSEIMTLEKGDLILTGTPEGVGPLKAGDRLEATLGDLCHLHVDVQEQGILKEV